MNPIHSFRLILIFILLWSLSIHAEEPVEEPTLIAPILAMVPHTMDTSRILNPRVVAKIQVTKDGSVEDVVVTEASDLLLVERAEKLIREARFKMPARDSAVSVRFDLHLPFHYPSDLAVVSISPSDDIRQVMSGSSIDEIGFKLHAPEELDTPPKLIDRGQVFRPDNDQGEPIPGSAIVEFYVNHRGEVSLPKVVSSSHPEVAIAALGTISDMKFVPPTVDGEPTVTIMQMPFSVK